MNYDKQISEIMDNFDFEEVHRTMVATNWWYVFENENRIPTLKEIRKVAKRLLKEVAADEGLVTESTGGFRAIKNNKKLSLYFIVELWEVD